MKNFKSKEKSLYLLLIKNYTIFTMVMVLLMVAVYFTESLAEKRILQRPHMDRPLGNLELLQEGKYEELSMKKLLGTFGYFEIVDAEGNVIFTDGEEKLQGYTIRELACIVPYNSSELYFVTEYETEDGKKQILLEKKYHEMDTGYQKDEAYWVLDENLMVISGNIKSTVTQFTKRELNFLTMRENARYEICGYDFIGSDGASYKLIMHIKGMDGKRYQKLSSIWKFFLPMYVVMFLIVTISFSFYIHRKVKEPLDMLKEGILAFAKGNRDTEMNYKGPREFEVMFDSFNVMAEKLKESEESKEKLILEKQRMLADISHDLKTPLTVISGYAKAVSDGLADEKTQEKYLQTISLKAENLTEMINSFYDYSKLEHPEFRLVRKKQDLAEFLREYLAFKYDEIELLGHRIEVEIPEEKVEYAFDEVQLKRVFDNILTNALKHNPKGTIIFVTLQQTERSIRIEIGDNGCGIPEEIRGSLFEPFTVGDDSRHNRQGSGLGLAVARKIMELHGGALFLEKAGNAAISTLFVLRFMR